MENFRVRIRDGEKEIEVQGTEKYVEKILKEFGYIDSEVAKNSKSKTSSPKIEKISNRFESPAEFILRAQVKKHTDIVVAFAYYLEKFKGLKKFSPADISNCYYEAKLETSNTSQMIIQNMKRGFLMPAKGDKDGKSGYTVTQTGIEHVEKILGKNK